MGSWADVRRAEGQVPQGPGVTGLTYGTWVDGLEILPADALTEEYSDSKFKFFWTTPFRYLLSRVESAYDDIERFRGVDLGATMRTMKEWFAEGYVSVPGPDILFDFPQDPGCPRAGWNVQGGHVHVRDRYGAVGNDRTNCDGGGPRKGAGA